MPNPNPQGPTRENHNCREFRQMDGTCVMCGKAVPVELGVATSHYIIADFDRIEDRCRAFAAKGEETKDHPCTQTFRISLTLERLKQTKRESFLRGVLLGVLLGLIPSAVVVVIYVTS